jgi:hypothetical protein
MVSEAGAVPSEVHPVAVFAGVDQGATHASFVLSPAVARASGDGRCSPDRKTCRMLTLKVGDAQSLRYKPEEGPSKTYHLAVVSIERIRIAGDSASPVSRTSRGG